MSVQVGQKSYKMPPRDGFSVTLFITISSRASMSTASSAAAWGTTYRRRFRRPLPKLWSMPTVSAEEGRAQRRLASQEVWAGLDLRMSAQRRQAMSGSLMNFTGTMTEALRSPSKFKERMVHTCRKRPGNL